MKSKPFWNQNLRCFALLAAISSSLVVPAYLWAQPSRTAVDPDSVLAVRLQAIQGEALTLDRAVMLALDHATVVREAKAALRAASGAFQAEKGAFDPEFFADVTRSRAENPSSSPFSRPDVIIEEGTEARAGARITLPFGTELEASFDANKIETNSAFAAIDPEYRVDGRLTVRQPLLKGFGPGTGSEKASAARTLDQARANGQAARLLAESEAEATYWELHAAERNFAVQQVIVDRAEALLEQARLRASAGLVGPNEVANARVFLAEQQLAAIDREEELDGVSDRLGSLMGTRPQQHVRFRPSDNPPDSFPVEPIEELLSRAYTNNEELRAARFAVDALAARESGARWNSFPALDVTGSIGGAGLAGSAREVVFGGDTLLVDVDGAYGDALSQSVQRDFPNWAVGIELSIPLLLREGRGEHNRLRAEVAIAEERVEALRRSIEESLRSAHRRLAHAGNRLTIAQEGVAASLDQVRIGLIEYDNGRATAFELVRLGSDLAGAQQRYSDALVRAARAAADVRYLTAGRTRHSDAGTGE